MTGLFSNSVSETIEGGDGDSTLSSFVPSEISASPGPASTRTFPETWTISRLEAWLASFCRSIDFERLVSRVVGAATGFFFGRPDWGGGGATSGFESWDNEHRLQVQAGFFSPEQFERQPPFSTFSSSLSLLVAVRGCDDECSTDVGFPAPSNHSMSLSLGRRYDRFPGVRANVTLSNTKTIDNARMTIFNLEMEFFIFHPNNPSALFLAVCL